jgi:hypothetical protein
MMYKSTFFNMIELFSLDQFTFSSRLHFILYFSVSVISRFLFCLSECLSSFLCIYFLSTFFAPLFFICENVYVRCVSFVSLLIFVFFTFLPFALFLCFSSFLSLRFVYFWTSILLLPVAVLLLTPSIAPLSVLQVHVS